MGLLSYVSPYHLLYLLVGYAVLKLAHRATLRQLARRRFEREHGCRPLVHHHGKDRIFGLDVMRETIRASKEHRLLDLIQGHMELYGYTYSSSLFTTPIIRTFEPENVKAVLSTRFKDYSLGHRQHAMGPLLGHGIFTSDGDHWVESRAMIRPNFAKDQVAELELFEDLIPDLFALIPRDGSTVDLQELFFSYTIDTATEFLFGTSVNSLKKKQLGKDSNDEFAVKFNHAQNVAWFRFRLGSLSRFYRDRKAEECNRFCQDYVYRFVEDAMAYRQTVDFDKEEEKEHGKKKNRYLFLQELAKHTSDKERLRDELLNVLLAGRDTTASLLTNLFFMLAKTPEVWKKLRQEVDALEGRLPSYEELRNMKYLKYCLNESLRMHPVVPINGRLCVTDTVLPLGGGSDGKSPVFVAKDTLVLYNVYVMHRRKDLYGPDADEFRPERWETLRPGWEYLPFNGGPRICPGQQYALTEAGYVTVRLLQEFKGIESRDPGPWEELVTFTTTSKNGAKVALTPG